MDKHTIKNEIEDKRKAIEDKGGIVCQNFNICHHRATRNLQNPMIVWKVKENGDTSRTPIEYCFNNIEGDTNIFICNECEPEF